MKEEDLLSTLISATTTLSKLLRYYFLNADRAQVHFKTRIFHPNIKQDTGEICAQAIENNWVPTLNAKFVIESLITLMKNPNAEHPLEAEIAELMLKDYKTFFAKAKEFSDTYAK